MWSPSQVGTIRGCVDAAKSTLLRILVERADAAGDETLTLTGSLPTEELPGGSVTLRFRVSIRNLTVFATHVYLHSDETGGD